MNIEVRPATDADGPAIDHLWRAATDELRAEKGGRVWAAQTARDGGWRPGDLNLVGTIDGVVVGYLRATLAELAGGDRLASVSDVYVEPGAREVGVGEGLLDAAVAWARDQGCIGIDAVVLPGMRASKNFFEAAGLVARLIVAHRSFD